MISRRSLLIGGAGSLMSAAARAQQIPLVLPHLGTNTGIPQIISTPLSLGLAFLWLPLDGLEVDLVSGIAAANTGVAPTPVRFGQQLTVPNGGFQLAWNGYGPLVTLDGVGTNDFTMAALVQPCVGCGPAGSDGSIVQQRGSGSNINLSANTDFNGAALSGGLSFNIFSGSVAGASTASGLFPSGNSAYFAMAGVRSGGGTGTCQIFVEGVDQTSTTLAAGGLDVRGNIGTAIGSGNGSDTGYPILFIAIWNRALSPAELATFRAAAFAKFLSQLIVWPSDVLAAMGMKAPQAANATLFSSPF